MSENIYQIKVLLYSNVVSMSHDFWKICVLFTVSKAFLNFECDTYLNEKFNKYSYLPS